MKGSFVGRGQLYFFTGLNSQQSTVPVFQFAKFSNFLVYTLYSIYVLSLSVSVLRFNLIYPRSFV